MNGDVHHFEKKSQRRIEFWGSVPSNYMKDLKNVTYIPKFGHLYNFFWDRI